jgi:hypothetical protein
VPTHAPIQSSSDPVGLYRLLFQPFLFYLDPERAHDLTLWFLQRLAQVPPLL